MVWYQITTEDLYVSTVDLVVPCVRLATVLSFLFFGLLFICSLFHPLCNKLDCLCCSGVWKCNPLCPSRSVFCSDLSFASMFYWTLHVFFSEHWSNPVKDRGRPGQKGQILEMSVGIALRNCNWVKQVSFQHIEWLFLHTWGIIVYRESKKCYIESLLIYIGKVWWQLVISAVLYTFYYRKTS